MPRIPLNPEYYIGKRYNKLLVLEYIGKKGKYQRLHFRCRCDCGNETIVRIVKMQGCVAKSCGCLRGKNNAKRSRNGLTSQHKRLYSIWNGIRQRCYNPKRKAYPQYGGRGIGISGEWRDDFKLFCEWSLSHEYHPSLSLDRIDNNKGYSKENCRWATHKTQQNNKSNNVFIIYRGIKRSCQEWSDLTGIKATTIASRFKKKWPLDKVFSNISYITVI